MGIELQRLENLLERKRLIRIVLEEILKQFADLLLAQSFSTFLLSHSFVFNYSVCKDTKKNEKSKI
jgi:hypothetical protein